MDIILYFFRDKITGTYYFIYAFICLMLMFAIIGYLYKQKYAKVEIKLNTSQPKKEEKVEANKQVKVENSNQRLNLFQKKQDNKASVIRPIIQPIPETPILNQPVNPAVQVVPNNLNKKVPLVNQQIIPQQTINQTQVVKPVQQPVNKSVEIK